MQERTPFLPIDIRSRLGWAAGTAVCGAVFFGLFGSGALAWNTWGYWTFVGATACLSFAICKYID